MPILGKTTDEQEVGLGLPRVMKLRKGGERPASGKAPGKDLKHFRADFAPEYAHLQPLWEKMYGTEPDTLHGVMLLGSTAEDAFPNWMEKYSASTMLIRCDGENQVRHYDPDTNKHSDDPIPCMSGGDLDNPQCGCKQRGTLTIVLPRFMVASKVLGTITVQTHSVYDIINIYNCLKDIERIYGTLQGLNFVLGRQEREVTVTIDGQKSKQVKSLLYINVDAEDVENKIFPKLGVPANGQALPPGTPANTQALPERSSHREDAPPPAKPPAKQAPARPPSKPSGGNNPLTGKPTKGQAPDEEPSALDLMDVGDTTVTTVESVEIKKARNGSNYLEIITPLGKVIAWTRQPFMQAGWIDETDWKDPGHKDYLADANPKATLKVVKGNKGQNVWELIEVEEFDPHFNVPDPDDIPEADWQDDAPDEEFAPPVNLGSDDDIPF